VFLVLFQYTDVKHEVLNGGLAVGLRSNRPWCNIIRHLLIADFYTIVAKGYELEKKIDATGFQGRTGDFCRTRIITTISHAYMVARVRRIGASIDSPLPSLVLELGLNFSKSDLSELGVLDLKLPRYR
jgi:hypothetical protein